MKKPIKILLIIVVAVVVFAVVIAQILPSIVFLGAFVFSSLPSKTFLESSKSPDGTYELEAYDTSGGATVDFSVAVYLLKENRKICIYNGYHEKDVEIIWVDNSTVTINGITLDLSKDERYDWRGPAYAYFNCGNNA